MVSKHLSARSGFVAVIALALMLLPGIATAQAIIKVNDTVNFKLGILLQVWGDEQQLSDAAGNTIGYQQNLFLRRARFFLGGQVAKDVSFFFMTDNPNLGKAVGATAKSLTTGFIVQDAYVEWKPINEWSLDAGLILVPFCRNCLESAASLVSLDYGTWSFQQGTATQASAGRDTGFQSKGYLLGDHLEYRAGIFQGFRAPGSKNSFRFVGRLQYDVFDVEKVPFYPGTYLGKKKILAFGGAYDAQDNYKGIAGDVFFDWPVGKDNSVVAQADYIRWDGGRTFTTPAVGGTLFVTNTLLKQDIFFAEAGFYLGGLKVMPWGRYEFQKFVDTVNLPLNKTNYSLGLTWYPYGHNFNFKGAWTRRELPNDPKTASTNEFTLQMQAFYF